MAPDIAAIPGPPAGTLDLPALPNRNARRSIARTTGTPFIRIPSPVVQCPTCGSHTRFPLSTLFRCCPAEGG